ncbi:MAG: hypothetical protein COV75_03110 [Candidatus Omnitrophica bacterium CG11_big_fil_rev_8_21_14_0_20_63_9]|nr:MAG: hypothetical protein COV75_03110 [Candidatus Omnitrophica bacterium CG11_big_fil_rev_8_21_14_0_20_63_9]
MKRAQTGATTVETTLLIGAVIAACVGMTVYIQRGYQGYLYGVSSAHGAQFDPTNEFSERQALESYTQVQDIDVTSGQAAIEAHGGGTVLTSPGGGQAAARILNVEARVTADWEVTREAAYEAK